MLLLALPRDAAADPGDVCVSSYEEGQAERKRGALVRSKANVRLCIGACPVALARDCQSWLAEVEKDVARITFTLRPAGGGPPTSASTCRCASTIPTWFRSTIGDARRTGDIT